MMAESLVLLSILAKYDRHLLMDGGDGGQKRLISERLSHRCMCHVYTLIMKIQTIRQ